MAPPRRMRLRMETDRDRRDGSRLYRLLADRARDPPRQNLAEEKRLCRRPSELRGSEAARKMAAKLARQMAGKVGVENGTALGLPQRQRFPRTLLGFPLGHALLRQRRL